MLRTLANLPRGGVRRRGANNVGEGYAGLRQQAKQASLELSIKVQSKDTLNNEKQIKRI